MIKVRKSDEIYRIKEDWFEGRWHFSFDRYHDPDNTSFGALRVFNVDTLVPGGVWPMHPHQDIEVITYCLDGAFQHADERGKDGVLHPGDVQHTTVGRGMFHEEINYSQTEPMTFLQIWIIPRERGLTPSMEQRTVSRKERLNRFLTLVSDKAPEALPIQQDAEFLVAAVEAGKSVTQVLDPGYGAYLYVASGQVKLDGEILAMGDAAKITGEQMAQVEAVEDSELAMVVVRV